MKLKKVLKIIGFILLLFIIVAGSYIAYYVYQYKKAFDVTDQPYKHIIGYIDQDKADLNQVYKLCGDGFIQRTYNGAGLDAYAVNKKEFRDQLALNYNASNFDDSGYLNFRFYVTCEGNAGWFETIEMDLDLTETKLDEKMVASLLEFTSDSKHWNILKYTQTNEAYNYYMYVSYRIEHGKVTEIIP